MKNLTKILAGGLALFIAIAMIQEWQVFFGAATDAAPPDRSAEKAEADKAVREFIALSRHLYQSGGDPRFAERLPASEQVSAELIREIAYLNDNGRVQNTRLVKLETRSLKALDVDRVEVRTKEYWVVDTQSVRDGKPTDPVVSQVVFISYRVKREGQRWRVVGWDLDEPPPPTDPGSQAPGSDEKGG